MSSKLIGVVMGVLGTLLWFMPFAEFEFMDMAMYQSGQHIGGMAYLLLATMAAYAVLSWRRQQELAIVAAAISLGVSLVFAISAGESTAWGLVSEIVLWAIALPCSVWLKRRQSRQQLPVSQTVPGRAMG